MNLEKCGFLTGLEISLPLQLEGIVALSEKGDIGMKGEREWKIKEKKGQGRLELGKRDRGGGLEKGNRRLRRKTREEKGNWERVATLPSWLLHKGCLLCPSAPERCFHYRGENFTLT